jgi:hypothetical protein
MTMMMMIIIIIVIIVIGIPYVEVKQGVSEHIC